MPNWYDITRNPDYQSLSDEDKLDLKREFFAQTIGKEPEYLAMQDGGKQATFYEFMTAPDDTGQGRITSAIGSAARGFAEVLPGAIEGAGALTGLEGVREAGQDLRGTIEEFAPVNPIYADTIPSKIAGVGGQVGSIFATGGLGGLAGRGLAGARIAAGATAAEQAALAAQAVERGAKTASYLSAGLQGAAEGAQQAERYGLEGTDAYLRTLAGAATELGSEMLPFGTVAETAAARRLLGESIEGAPGIRKAALTEGAEEAAAQIGGNIATQALAPLGTETPGTFEGVTEATLLGAAGGGMFGLANRLTAPRAPTVATPPPVQPAAATATPEVAANVAEADMGMPRKAGTPITLDGQNYTISIPPESTIAPETVAGFYDDPDTLRALADRGYIRLEQVITPAETVDTTPLNDNLAVSAALAPQTVAAAAKMTADLRPFVEDAKATRDRLTANTGVSSAPIPQPAVTTAQETPVAPAQSGGGSLGQSSIAAGGSIPAVTEPTVPQTTDVSSPEIEAAADPFAASTLTQLKQLNARNTGAEIPAATEAVKPDIVTFVHTTKTAPGKGQTSGYYPGTYSYESESGLLPSMEGNKFVGSLPEERIYTLQGSDQLKKDAAQAGFGFHSGNGNAEINYLKSLGYKAMRRGSMGGTEIIVFDTKDANFKPVSGQPDLGAGGVAPKKVDSGGATQQSLGGYEQKSTKRSGERGGRSPSGEATQGVSAPLPGAPVVQGAAGPDPQIVEVARAYAASIGIPFGRQKEYAKVDPERAKRIAMAYEQMEHAPTDPVVRRAYDELIKQTLDQYRALEAAGYQFWLFDDNSDPYNGSPWAAMRDLRNNKSMAVFATEAGFGSQNTGLDTSDSPLMRDTGIRWSFGSPDGPKKRVLANDLFRAVHDAFGHGLEGAGFRAQGEENAWQAHVRLFTGPAVGAITTETRGQNSWLNFGPHGEKNQSASVEDTVFADQKTGLLPPWAWEEGRVDHEIEQPPAPPTNAPAPQIVETGVPAKPAKGTRRRKIPQASTGDQLPSPEGSVEQARKFALEDALTEAEGKKAVRLIDADSPSRSVIVARDPEDPQSWRATLFQGDEPVRHELFSTQRNAVSWVFGEEDTQSGNWQVQRKPANAARRKEVSDALMAQLRGEGIEVSLQGSPAPLRPKFEAGETVTFKVNGQPVIGTIQRVSGGGNATVTYNWNGKKDQEIVLRTSEIQRPVLALAEAPNYKYTQEQNTRKAARFGIPTEPGVTVNAAPVITSALERIASDTAMPPMLRAVARALQRQNYEGVDLRIEADGRRWYAGYYLNDNGITEIGLNLRNVGRGQLDAVSVFLHEALHHVTLAKIRDPQGEVETQAVEALDTLRKRIKAYAGMQQKATKFSYELGTVDEFITALFTRPDFQDFIAGIPDTFVPGTPGSKFRSVLSEIFRIIAQLVTGQRVQKGGMLDQAFASSLTLFETPQRAARGAGVDYAMAENALSPEKYTRHAELEAKHNAGTITPEETAEAQALVNEAAKAAGYETEAYHGSEEEFNEFKNQRTAYGFFFAPDKRTAEFYGPAKKFYLRTANMADFTDPADFSKVAEEAIWSDAKTRSEEKVKEWIASAVRDTSGGRLFAAKVLDLTDEQMAEYESFNDILRDLKKEWEQVVEVVEEEYPQALASLDKAAPAFNEEVENARKAHDDLEQSWYMDYQDDFVTAAQTLGYDSVFMQDPAGSTGGSPESFVVFSPEQIKSADPFTGVPLEQRFQPASPDIRFSTTDTAASETEPVFTPDEARAILTKRFGKAVADKIIVEVMAPRRMGNREVEVDAELRGGTISLNLKFMDNEDILVQKAEHEMAHAVYSDKKVQDAWRDLSASMPPDVRQRITERMKQAGYDPRVLNEEVLVRFFEEVRATTPPSKWKAFMDAVIDAFRRFFGAAPDERTARLAAARIIAAGEAAVARGLDPSKQAFGQSVSDLIGAMDAEYMAAVEAGDMEKAQRMVDEAAKAAGFNVSGVGNGVTYEAGNEPDSVYGERDNVMSHGGTFGFYFSDNPDVWSDYAKPRRKGEKGRVNRTFLSLKNPFRFSEELISYDAFQKLLRDGGIALPAEVKSRLDRLVAGGLGDTQPVWKWLHPTHVGAGASYGESLKKAFTKAGYDGVIHPDSSLMEGGLDTPATSYVVFSPSQIKSADPVTRDDAGNVILLSKRFGPSPDIRFSVATQRDYAFQRNLTGEAAEMKNLATIRPWKETVRLAREIIEPYKKADTSKDKMAGRREALQRLMTDTSIDPNVRAAGFMQLALETDTLASVAKTPEQQAAYDDFSSIPATGYGVLESSIDPASVKFDSVSQMMEMGTEAGRMLNTFRLLAAMTPDGFIRKSERVRRKKVDEATEQQFGTTPQKLLELMWNETAKAERDAVEKAKKEIKRRSPEAIAKAAIDRLNEMLAGPPRPRGKPSEVSELLRKHLYNPVEGFSDKLVALGVEKETADALDAVAATVRADLAKLEEANAVERLTKSLKPKTRAAKSAIPRLMRVLLEAGKTGAFDSKAFNDALAEAFNFPPMTAEQDAEIRRMVAEINKLPMGAARVDKQQELQNYVAMVQGIPARDVLMSALYANWLSGISTQLVALAGNSANIGLRSFFIAMTNNPEDVKNYFRGALGIGAKAGFSEAKAALGNLAKLAKGQEDTVRGQFKIGRLDSPQIANALEVLFRKGPTTPAEWVAYIASIGTRTRAVFRLMMAIDSVFWNSAREGMYHLAASRTVRKMAKEQNMTKEEANAEFIRQLGGGPEVFEAALKDAEAALKDAGQPADMATMTRMAYEAINRAREKENPEAVKEANRFADRIVFQGEPEGIGRLISKIISALQQLLTPLGFPLGQMLVPFNKIVSSLFEQSLDYTGLGLVRGVLGMHLSDARIDWSKGVVPHLTPAQNAKVFSDVERRERAMAGFFGLTLSAAAYLAAKSHMGDDDDEVPFMLYAFGPSDKNKREQMPAGWVPFSIKVGDTYYRYAEWPLGMVLAGFAAALDAERYGNMKEKDTMDRIGYSAMLGLKGFMTQGVLSNVDTAIDALMFKATGKKYTDIPVNAAKGLIPAQGFLRDISSLFDNTKVSNDDVMSALLRDVPFAKSLGTKPQLNVFGEPVEMEGEAILRRFLTQRRPHPTADYLTRNKLYIPGMAETVDVGDYLPASERDRFKRRAMQMAAMDNGVFTPEQNYAFRKRAGELTKSAVERIMKQAPAIKTEEQRKAVQNLIDKQVALARRRAMVEAVPYQPPPAQ